LLKGEVLMSALSKVAMTALKIAAIGQLKFKVSKRGNGRPADELFFPKGCVGPANEILREAILNKLFVLFPDNRPFSLGAPEEKLVGVLAEFVEFIIVDVVNTGPLEILQGAVWINGDELIPGWHR
jgi:hypothetical protein